MSSRTERIWVSRYVLRSRRPLSALTGTTLERRGALLRIETSEGTGYSDLHPWSELGDGDLDDQLAAFKARRPQPLGARSRELAELDRRARARGVSAFAGLPLAPANHRLVSVGDLDDEGFLSELAVSGVRTLKLKLAKDGARALAESAGALREFRLRLDFNGQLTPSEYFEFLERLPSAVRAAIDFVEDPVPPNAPDWGSVVARSPVPIALDRGGETSAFEAPYFVWKPALQKPEVARTRAGRGAKICATSYLDHPVGQMGAALESARLMSEGVALETGGLASHFSYEPNEFSEVLSVHAGVLVPVAGTGIGFDELLARQDWREL